MFSAIRYQRGVQEMLILGIIDMTKGRANVALGVGQGSLPYRYEGGPSPLYAERSEL